MDLLQLINKKKYLLNSENFQNFRYYFYENFNITIVNEFSYEENLDNRAIFKNNNFNSIINLQANGLILNLKNLQPLVMPIPKFFPLFHHTLHHNVKKNLSKIKYYYENNSYDIYFIKNTTIINLYWWKNKWTLSTNNGYDVTNIKWNNLSYYDCLIEILIENNILPSDFFNSLNKLKCYIFLIKHPNFQIFTNNTKLYDIWLVKEKYLYSKKMLENKNDDNNTALKKMIKMQKKYKKNINNFDNIIYQSENALENFILDGKIFFGYIFISNKLKNIYKNVIIESTLFKKIKFLSYEKKINKFISDNQYDRKLFLILRAYLTNNRMFLKLFPNFSHLYDFINLVQNIYIKNLLNFNKKNKFWLKIFADLNDFINKNYKINHLKKQNIYKKKNFLTSEHFINFYYDIITKYYFKHSKIIINKLKLELKSSFLIPQDKKFYESLVNKIKPSYNKNTTLLNNDTFIFQFSEDLYQINKYEDNIIKYHNCIGKIKNFNLILLKLNLISNFNGVLVISDENSIDLMTKKKNIIQLYNKLLTYYDTKHKDYDLKLFVLNQYALIRRIDIIEHYLLFHNNDKIIDYLANNILYIHINNNNESLRTKKIKNKYQIYSEVIYNFMKSEQYKSKFEPTLQKISNFLRSELFRNTFEYILRDLNLEKWELMLSTLTTKKKINVYF